MKQHKTIRRLRRYADYDHPKVCQSEGTVSWLKYKAYRDSMHYDSFIMGSSCTKAFSTADWNQYIHGRPFRMFCNNEGVADLYSLCVKTASLSMPTCKTM